MRDAGIRNTYVVEIRDLRALLAVVRTGSFTAAAQELGYTQSAVSQQIAALEQEAGRRLLDRRPVRPTAAGARLAEHAARIVLRMDVARSELAELDEEDTRLRVDICVLAAPGVLAAALRDLRRERPLLRAMVRSTDAVAAVGDVAEATVDAALVDGITAPGSPLALTDAGVLASTGIVEVPLVVAFPAGHPLGSRDGIDLGMLTDAPWIVAPSLPPPGPALPPGGSPIAYHGNDLATLLSLVAAGHGTALLPDTGWATPAGVVRVRLRHPQLVHRTELLTLRAPTPLVRRLTEALRNRSFS
jgi:DNA-binding transcriptional LysR family regulator